MSLAIVGVIMATSARPTTNQDLRVLVSRPSAATYALPPAVPRAPDASARAEGARRALNFAVALLGIVVAAPLMACIALLIKLASRGPILYTQTRVGVDRRWLRPHSDNGRRHWDHGGLPFTIFKFRTMRPSGGDPEMWATPDDPRVTAVGRVLRKYRLDELPQLLNVLLGDMNLVGPRPEQLAIFAQLRNQIPGYERRQRVRPGITGWAQVNQHYDRSIDDVKHKVEYDLEYVRRQSVVEDLRIMLRTIPVVVFRRGAW